MREIKEELKESKRLQELIEFLEDFESEKGNEFVTRSQITKLLLSFWEGCKKKFKQI